MNVMSAFLNGDLKEEVFVEQTLDLQRPYSKGMQVEKGLLWFETVPSPVV